VRWKASVVEVLCPRVQYHDQGRRPRVEVATMIEGTEPMKARMDIDISLMVS
jgi:hypothetical protein